MNLAGFEEWLEQVGTSPHTRRAYPRLLNDFAAFVVDGSGRDLDAVMADEYERAFAARDWRNHLKHEKGHAPISVNQALCALRAYCRFAGLSIPDVKREDMPSLAPRALEEDEQIRLLRAVETFDGSTAVRDRAIVHTLFHAGLRVGEVSGLNLADVIVSDRRGKLIVRKGTGDRLRETPLADAARKSMLEWTKERREVWGEPGDPDVAPCFVNYRGGRLSTRSMDKLMDTLGESAGIGNLTAHVLRHTFTTNLIRAGNDIALVARMAGHVRLETIRRYHWPPIPPTRRDPAREREGEGTENANKAR